MAVYFLTGKLGAGKTLAAVGRIRDYLIQGRPVATNLDIDLVKLVGPKAKSPVLYRLPDKPSLVDFETIGKGNTSYDESRNGLIVLDECGTWFNSRTWGDKERQSIINWFLHARKLGWDLIFIVQSIAIVDKQARLTLAEHVVYCRRLDKVTIPFVSSIWKLLFDKPLRLPQIHMAIVKYGDQPTSLTVDKWWYLGRDLYPAYDTKQAFSDFYDTPVYQLLPPWLIRGRYMVSMTWKNKMRLTKIYWKRFSRPVVAGAFFVAGVLLAVLQQPETFPESLPVVSESEIESEKEQKKDSGEGAFVSSDAVAEKLKPTSDKYSAWRANGYIQKGDRLLHSLRDPAGVVHSLDSIRDAFAIIRNRCHIRLVNHDDSDDYADLYLQSCTPDDLPPGVSDSAQYMARVQSLSRHYENVRTSFDFAPVRQEVILSERISPAPRP